MVWKPYIFPLFLVKIIILNVRSIWLVGFVQSGCTGMWLYSCTQIPACVGWWLGVWIHLIHIIHLNNFTHLTYMTNSTFIVMSYALFLDLLDSLKMLDLLDLLDF